MYRYLVLCQFNCAATDVDELLQSVEMARMFRFQDNEKTRDVMIDHRFHKAIIGAQGSNIRDIRDKFNSVVISFPDPSKQSDVVSLRGPKNDVDQCYKYLHQMAQDMVSYCLSSCIVGYLSFALRQIICLLVILHLEIRIDILYLFLLYL